MATIYIDEAVGIDESTQLGTEESPFKTLQFAYFQHPAQAQYLIRSPTPVAPENDAADDESKDTVWKAATKTALKKVVNYYEQQKKKQAREQELADKRQQEEEERNAALEKAKEIVLKDDPSLPRPIKIRLDEVGDYIKLRDMDDPASKGTRIHVIGRVHRERKQKDVLFLTLRDGYGYMQVVISGDLAKSYEAVTLTRETSMEIFGEMRKVPGRAKAPLGRELHADFFKIPDHWRAAGGDEAITNRVASDTDHSILLNLRHLTIRGETASAVMLVRDAVEFAFSQAFRELRIRKVSPPALVQTQVEGGATLFKLDYFGEDAFLTQSSQLYLETCLPSLGDVYCIEKSFRAEKSLTRRHLSEFTHVEAELDFITFDDLLNNIEHMICRVVEIVMSDPITAGYVKTLNPTFEPPQRPFMRMTYKQAIKWLKDKKVRNEQGEIHEFGEDIAEAAERSMTDEIGVPILLTHFPAEIKAFYMQKAEHDKELTENDMPVTESVDCLMPGVGEIVGGSMRINDLKELLAAFEREELDPSAYYWYTDQRKYGSSPHGGWGLGLERFLAWMCGQHTVRDCCLYPRYTGRCAP